MPRWAEKQALTLFLYVMENDKLKLKADFGVSVGIFYYYSMKKIFLLLVSMGVIMAHAKATSCQMTATGDYNDGNTFVADNADGFTLKYEVISATDKTVRVVRGDNYINATRITIPSQVDGFTVIEIGQGSFSECQNLTSVSIPNTIVGIRPFAFKRCNKLTAITIPASVTSINEEAFMECGLTALTIPGTVESIGNEAFEQNQNLKTLVIENGVKKISREAFGGCTSLTSFFLPSSVTKIEYGILWGCSSMTSMSVDSGNTVYDSRDNCNGIIETATNTLVMAYDKTVIPASVTAIGEDAFTLSYVTKVVLHEGVTSIGEGAFYKEESLRSITIPSTVSQIGESAFYGCVNLSEIYSRIKRPFAIDEYTFKYGDNGFKQIPATLYVPIGTKTLYENTAGWKEFTNIIEKDYTDPEPQDDESADISRINMEPRSEKGAIYDLQGRQMTRPGGKGIYIREGRKIIVK